MDDKEEIGKNEGVMPEKEAEPVKPDNDGKKPKKARHHWIHPKWLRITLKTIMWIIIAVILVPVLLYVPPVQTWVKDIACSVVKKSTGMDIKIDKFRLKWPLDVSLKDVSVVEADGDTMVYAKEVIADVKLAPLFKLDVDVKKLSLLDAGFNMVSPDSSMKLRLKAGFLEVDDKSSVDIKTLDINLNQVYLKDGNLSLVMDVWQQKKTPQDSTATTPLTINMHEVTLENFGFEMAMLPVIDTLKFSSQKIELRNGLVDLEKNLVKAQYLGADNGDVVFIAPTPEYVAAHPAPVDTVPSDTPPMVIEGDTVTISGFKALYAIKDAKPLPGFDPSYIEVSDVGITLKDFYDEGPTLRLPITKLEAKERSGLQIIEGNGTIGIDSLGINLKDVEIRTLYSELSANAGIPFSLMELKPYAPVNVNMQGSVGLPDVEAFMPDLKAYTSKIPLRTPLTFEIRTEGTLGNLRVPVLEAGMKDIFSIKADGYAINAFDYKKLDADIDFSGSVTNPGVVDKIAGLKDFKFPKLSIKGTAKAKNENYMADFVMKSGMGNVAAKGKVNLNSEKYNAEITVHDLDMKQIMPAMGIGKVTLELTADGAGFNPLKKHAATDIQLDIPSIIYNGEELNDITLLATLEDGAFKVDLESPNSELNLKVNGDGTISDDYYTIDLTAVLGNIDLQSLGITKEENGGSAIISLTGNASPEKWLYDLNLTVRNLEWTVGNDFYDFPGTFDLKFYGGVSNVDATLTANRTVLDFASPRNLKDLISSFTAVGDSVGKQIERKDLNVEWLQHALPPFTLNLDASGAGLLGDYLGALGLSVDTLNAHFENDSIISGNVKILELANSSLRADTLTFNLMQRGTLLDYKAHMGNRSNNSLAEFADVNINGYLGSNRVMVGLMQKNQKGVTGYRLGLTGAFMDSTINIHFTPLKATIGYIPWTFNDDNFVELNMKNYRVDANLLAQSATSSILIKTQQGEHGNDELHLVLDNIRIQDFLNLPVYSPPITASINMDLNIGYLNNWLYGTGSLEIDSLTYDKQRVGDFDLAFRAGLNDGGSTGARLSLKIDGNEALTAKALLGPDTLGHPQVKTMGLSLTRFPLKIGNAFLGADVARLSGYLNGDFSLSGTLTEPLLNGYLACDSVGVFIPMMGSSIKFNADSITVSDNVVAFHDFDIWGANDNPITINGTVDAKKFSEISFDLGLNAQNFQLINNDSKAKSDLYGKLFFDLQASARGPLEHFNVMGNVNILSNTNVTYSIPMTAARLTQHDATGVVKFVNFNDTVHVAKEDTVSSAVGMRVLAGLTLQPGMQVQVIYPGSATTGNAKIEISPSGTLNYFQNYMGDMRLNGEIYLGNGYAKYSMPIVGEKKFVFNPESYVQFNGDILNPSFNISATDEVKASVIEGKNSHIVTFLVELDISHNLADPKIEFNLNTEDDITVKNELMSMTPDQRSMAALNMLLTGQYTGNGTKTASGDLLQGTMYNILTSQINGWLANNVKGVDINLGVDQYDNMVNGETGTSTSYSYSLSKSLFNNKFKISVGGNYTTDASADENFSENLISDISFEYILKQTTNVTMYARLFRHTGYESILEGEITETGIGFLLRRRLANLKDLFKWGSKTRMLPPLPPPAQHPAEAGKDSADMRTKAEKDSLDIKQKDHEKER